ncbi:MAG: cobalt-precorrin 5A hydrolase [Clostridia bacterium]|nr:cobalt-precorrin 5A hydrolase [Clostridia bacterium]
MKISMFAYTNSGRGLIERMKAFFEGDEVKMYVPKRLSADGFFVIPDASAPLYEALFNQSDALIFAGSCGIAIRCIAPYIRDKRTDPAVLAIDEAGRFVIPLLSGHIGGANALAERIAARSGAAAVITTATDVRGRFSPDAWAAKNGLIIDDTDAAKAVSAAILERDVPLLCELPVTGGLPAGVYEGESGDVGILIGFTTHGAPFEKTLRLIPKILRVGIGCKRGTGAERIRAAVSDVFTREGLDLRAVKCFATIDMKADEPGLKDYCCAEKKPLEVYSAEELRAVSGEFEPSDFVKSITGVDNVCERAAMAGAHRLIVKKTARDGVTVAVAAQYTEVRFE